MNRTAMMFFMLGLAASPSALAAPAKQPAALSAPELTAGVRRALLGYEPLDAQRDIRALAEGSGATAVTDALLRLIRDDSTSGILRLSATEALGYAPAEAGRTYLHEVLGQLGKSGADDDRVFTLAAALRALGSFSPSELPRLSPYLQHKSADVREAAVLGLTRCGASPVEISALLHKRLAVESDSGVKEILRSALASLPTAAR